TALNLKKNRKLTFYVLGDGLRYFVAKKQALIMFMEGCKQNAAPMQTEEFIHSLIETLEPENPIKNPVILLKPEESFVSKKKIEFIDYVISTWRELAGEDKVYIVMPYKFIKTDLEEDLLDYLSPFSYFIPLEWLTYYYALSLGIDPGESKLVKKVRMKNIG
ncbi:MAG: hypothetical protein ACTSYR_05510, partial [Candidatus Odinarchaeia archaeon]